MLSPRNSVTTKWQYNKPCESMSEHCSITSKNTQELCSALNQAPKKLHILCRQKPGSEKQ